jgi:hypothetical protein
MHAFADAAATGVVDKEALEYRRDVVVDEMVNNTVAEIRREYLAFYRVIYYKAYTWAYRIAVFENFIGQIKDIVFKIFLERQSVDGISFVPPGIEICMEKVGNNSLSLIGIHGLIPLKKVPRGTNPRGLPFPVKSRKSRTEKPYFLLLLFLFRFSLL